MLATQVSLSLSHGLRCRALSIRIIAVLSFFFVCAFISAHTYANDDGVVLDAGWQYRWGDSPFDQNGVPVWTHISSDQTAWTNIDFPSDPPGRDGQKNVWYRTTLPSGEWRDPVLYIYSIDLIAEVYLDGEQIYHYGTFDENGQGQFEGWPWHMISLPRHVAGKTIYFRIFSSYSDIGLWGEVKLMERLDLFKYIISNSMEKIAISGISLLIGLMALIFAFAQQDRRTYLLISAFTLASSAMLFSQSQAKQLIVNAPLAWDHVSAISYFSLPIIMALLFGTWCQGKYHGFIRVIWMTHSAFLVVAIGGSLIGALELSTMYLWFDVLLSVSILILFSIAFSRFKTVTGVVRVSISAFAVFNLFLLIDMGVAHNFLPWTRMPIAWGLLVFALTLIAISIRQFALTQKELKELNLTLEQKVTARTSELNEKRELLTQAHQLAKLGNWQHDLRSNQLTWSDEIYSIFGISPDEFQPTLESFMDRVHPNDRAYVRTEYMLSLQGEKDYDIQHRIVRIDNGETRWLHEWCEHNRDENGKVIKSFGTVQDITERKAGEEALLQAKDEVEKASRAKSEFLASMSHELRTPLNAVLGFAQVLQYDPKHPLDPVQNEHVENILTGGHHLLDLVDEILELAKIEADQLSITLDEVDAKDVIGQSIALARSLSHERNVEIIDNTQHSYDAKLRTDRTRFKQVLVNLLTNAIKFNKDNGTVTVSAETLDNGYMRLSVSDTGIGIADEDRSSVFQLFHRLGADPAIAREGTGIGLTITKTILEHMAGTIDFKSELGKGTTFWVELPLVTNDDVMIWTDAMITGVKAIDADHKVLMKMLNTISKDALENEKLDEIVDGLVDYTNYHFKREETIMEICGYPGLVEHRKIHQSISKEVDALADAWRQNRTVDLLSKLHKFLQDWLFSHIIHEDTRIEGHAKGKKQEIKHALDVMTHLSAPQND